MRRLLVTTLMFISSLMCYSAASLPLERTYNVVLDYDPQVLDIGFISSPLGSFDSEITESMGVSEIELGFGSDTNKATGPAADKPCYVYWKVYSADNLNVSLSADNLKYGETDSIVYTVKIGDDDSYDDLVSGSNQSVLLLEYNSKERNKFGSEQLAITTEDLQDKATAKYSGNITVTIDGGNAS